MQHVRFTTYVEDRTFPNVFRIHRSTELIDGVRLYAVTYGHSSINQLTRAQAFRYWLITARKAIIWRDSFSDYTYMV